MKKVVSLLLASALVLGMSTVSFAATKAAGYVGTPTVTEINADLNAGQGGAWVIPALVDANGNAVTMVAKDVKNAKVTVKSSLKSGSKFLDEVKIDNVKVGGVDTAAIVFSVVDPFVSTSDVDYDYTFYLAFDGKRNNSVEYHASGSICIKTTDVGADDDYVDLSAGQVADVSAYVKAIEVDLGNGVSIFTKLYNGKKYFGVADSDVSETDDAMITKYPEIQNVITLTTIGLNAAGNIVKLNDYGSETYVYDKDLKYLGTANEMLPYSTKYYLTNVKLAEEAAEGEDGDAPTEGDDEAPSDVEAPSNTNDNPGTGR